MKRFNFHSTLNVPLLPSATKLRRLCFYTCVSVHGGGVGSVHAGIPPPRSRHPLGSRHPPHPPSRRLLLQTATVADGTHPTGMHSCSLQVYILKYELSIQSGFHKYTILTLLPILCIPIYLQFPSLFAQYNVRKCK